MNKKGFTLIELLGSIVILAALALVAFPAILSVLNSGQEEVDESVVNFVKAAAEECVNDNIDDYGDCLSNSSQDKCKCDDFAKLKDNGYISTTFYDKHINDIKGKITIEEHNNKYCYGYGDLTEDEEYQKCMD